MEANSQIQRDILPKNGKDMLISSVRLVVIFNNYLSVAIFNNYLSVAIYNSLVIMTHWVTTQRSLTTLLFSVDGYVH